MGLSWLYERLRDREDLVRHLPPPPLYYDPRHQAVHAAAVAWHEARVEELSRRLGILPESGGATRTRDTRPPHTGCS